MKKIFVAAPPKFGMNEEEVIAFRQRLERLAYEAEQKIGEYCEINTHSLRWLLDDTPSGIPKDCVRRFIFDAIQEMCGADYAVFSDDWRTSKECSLLHYVAEALDFSILEVFG